MLNCLELQIQNVNKQTVGQFIYTLIKDDNVENLMNLL